MKAVRMGVKNVTPELHGKCTVHDTTYAILHLQQAKAKVVLLSLRAEGAAADLQFLGR